MPAKTKIILQKDIPNLGIAGDVKDVSNGYARNYLLPRRLAVPATERTTAIWDAKKEQLAQERSEKLAQAQELGKKIQEVSVGRAVRAGQDGKLFGSITAADIASSLIEKGLPVDRRWVELKEPIRSTGEFTGSVRLHPQVRVNFKIQISAVS
jgi:large subunit ribosomal protein L9